MKGEDRHSFNRKPLPAGMVVEDRRFCLRCGLARKWTPEGWAYLERQGWTDKAPPCLQVRAENEARERLLVEKMEALARDPLGKISPPS